MPPTVGFTLCPPAWPESCSALAMLASGLRSIATEAAATMSLRMWCLPEYGLVPRQAVVPRGATTVSRRGSAGVVRPAGGRAGVLPRRCEHGRGEVEQAGARLGVSP